jgi:hypothetical protein
VCVQAFEGISRCSEVAVSHSGAISPAICVWPLLGWLWLFIVSRQSTNWFHVNTLLSITSLNSFWRWILSQYRHISLQ